MTSVYRVTAVWNGFQGAPGYTKLSFLDLTTDTNRNAAGAAVKAWFGAFTSYLLNSWNVLVQPTIQEFDQQTGTLIGEAVMTTPPTATLGILTPTAFAGGSGVCVSWKTTYFFLGRRVQGRTFMVPFVGPFDIDGTLNTSFINTANTANTTLINATNAELAVWAKTWNIPLPGQPRVQTGGIAAPVTTAVVKDMASQLRSRRT